MSEQKVQCRLCEQFFDDVDMSEEHYPAHSVGNEDIIQLDFIKLADDFMGENKELNRKIGNAIRNGENLQSTVEEYFYNSLAEDLYPKGRTAQTGKIDWNMEGKMLVFELSDEKFIFNLLNFEKHDVFEMNNIFDIMEKNTLWL